jgi:hypothetical protein
MVNYAELADKARARLDADKLAADRQKNLIDASQAFFEGLKEHLIEELDLVNVELRKRGVPEIRRNHLPGFLKEIFLTYGTDSLCRVGLESMGEQCRIMAVINGPPNGFEVSRKEYLFSQEASSFREVLVIGEAGSPTGVANPAEIAVDIISSVLLGKFQ